MAMRRSRRRVLARNSRGSPGRACPLCPSISDLNLLRDRERVVDLDAEISDGAFNLGMTKQELHCSEVAGAPVYQRGLGSPQGMRSEHLWIEPNACHPIRKEASILTRCHGPAQPAAAGEQILASLLSGRPQIVVNSLAGLIHQLKLDRSPSLLLPNCRAIERVAIRSDILDPQRDDVATT